MAHVLCRSIGNLLDVLLVTPYTGDPPTLIHKTNHGFLTVHHLYIYSTKGLAVSDHQQAN